MHPKNMESVTRKHFTLLNGFVKKMQFKIFAKIVAFLNTETIV